MSKLKIKNDTFYAFDTNATVAISKTAFKEHNYKIKCFYLEDEDKASVVGTTIQYNLTETLPNMNIKANINGKLKDTKFICRVGDNKDIFLFKTNDNKEMLFLKEEKDKLIAYDRNANFVVLEYEPPKLCLNDSEIELLLEVNLNTNRNVVKFKEPQKAYG